MKILNILLVFLLLSSFISAGSKKNKPTTSDIYDLVYTQFNEIPKSPQLSVFGTEYTLGQTALPFIQLINSTTNLPIENSTCFIDIYSPNVTKTEFVNDAVMIEKEEGLYYYEFIPTEIGNHMVGVKCKLSAQKLTTTYNSKNITGVIYAGGFGDTEVLDGNSINLRPTGSVIVFEKNITITQNAINITEINLFASVKRDTASFKTFSICVWNYKTKKYEACSDEGITNEFTLINNNLIVNSTGSNYLNSTTAFSGTLSIRLNSSDSLGSGDYFFDLLNGNILTDKNESLVIRGGGELHISANNSITSSSFICNNTAVINAINSANSSVHLALYSNFSNLNESITQKNLTLYVSNYTTVLNFTNQTLSVNNYTVETQIINLTNQTINVTVDNYTINVTTQIINLTNQSVNTSSIENTVNLIYNDTGFIINQSDKILNETQYGTNQTNIVIKNEGILIKIGNSIKNLSAYIVSILEKVFSVWLPI